ncbi:uncharacterized protein G2W53_022210 [Senna tora]|uniref:Uncharacterized protein n=1 Tax=Senna tora TaxID=362788 RepID=A0A834TNA8_9FABA|nr:uncharacterized protein G2W53_022210 [Senna tora]
MAFYSGEILFQKQVPKPQEPPLYSLTNAFYHDWLSKFSPPL